MMACLASGMERDQVWIEQVMLSVTQIWRARLQQAVCLR